MIHYGSSFEGFVQLVGDRARIFESEVRDLLSLVEGRSIVGLPSGSSGVPPGAVIPPPPKQVPEGEAGRSREAESPKAGGVHPPGVEPKAKPGVRFGAAEPQEFKEIPVKKEVSEEEEKQPERTPGKEKKEKKDRGDKKKRRSHSRKRKKSSEERPRNEEKAHKKRRIEDSEADKEERKREEESSPRKPEGKERKTREREEGEEAKEGEGGSSSAWRPEPSSGHSGWYQPRGERPQQGDKPPHTKGWQGRVPYSEHPRWSEGKNKGVVKRAKQERYHRRYR